RIASVFVSPVSLAISSASRSTSGFLMFSPMERRVESRCAERCLEYTVLHRAIKGIDAGAEGRCEGDDLLGRRICVRLPGHTAVVGAARAHRRATRARARRRAPRRDRTGRTLLPVVV